MLVTFAKQLQATRVHCSLSISIYAVVYRERQGATELKAQLWQLAEQTCVFLLFHTCVRTKSTFELELGLVWGKNWSLAWRVEG